MTSRSKLFHGTVADIAVGDVIRPLGRGAPNSVHRSQGYRWGQRSDEHAFATEKEHEAWQYAGMATHPPRNPGSLGSNDPPKGRQRVYRVEPADPTDVKMGRYHPDHPANAKRPVEKWHEHVSKAGFRVVERIDLHQGSSEYRPTLHSTLPLDWNVHKADPRSHRDANFDYDQDFEQHRVGGKQNLMHNTFAAGDGPDVHDPNVKAQVAEHTAQVPGQMELNLGPQFRSKQ